MAVVSNGRPRESPPDPPERLESWKQISGYLGRGERTVRRWEQQEGLPVHRHVHQLRGSVWASPAELDEWLAQRQAAPSKPEATGRGEIWTPVLAGAVVFGAIALAALVWINRGKPASASLPPSLPLTSYPNQESEASFSPDGRRVAFHWGGPQVKSGIYIKGLDTDTPQPLMIEAGLNYNPVWSPDGNWIAFLRRVKGGNTHLMLIAPSGGAARLVAELHTTVTMQHAHLAWTPDGKWLFAPAATGGGPPGIHLVSAETGEMTRLTEPLPPALRDYAPALSRDGRTLVFLRQTYAMDDAVMSLYRIDLKPDYRAMGEPQLLFSGKGGFAGLAWTPTGKDLVTCYGNQLYRREARPGAESVPLGPPGCFTLAVSRPDSSGAAMLVYGKAFEETDLWRVSLGGNEPPSKIASSTLIDRNPEYSPDGKRMAFISHRSGFAELWTAQAADGSDSRRITALRADIGGTPNYSPSGTELIFSANHGEAASQVYTIPAAGGEPRTLTSGTQPARDPSWSRDGTHIYYSSPVADKFQIWRARADGSGAVPLTRKGGNVSRETADGGYVVYSRYDGQYQLCAVPVEGGAEQILQEDIARPWGFTVTGRGIYSLRNGAGASLLELIPAPGATPQRAGQLPPGTHGGFTVSPDGAHVIFTKSERGEIDLQIVRGFR